MARMLGYKELPEEQYKLLRKVFNYVDSDQDGNITPAELKAVVERFGLKMASSQLEQYIQEFDANNDGQINLTEFCNLMSKLHGRLGITTNPTMIAKDLQLTVTKLEQLVSNNNIKTTEALDALVAEAKLDAPSFLERLPCQTRTRAGGGRIQQRCGDGGNGGRSGCCCGGAASRVAGRSRAKGR